MSLNLIDMKCLNDAGLIEIAWFFNILFFLCHLYKNDLQAWNMVNILITYQPYYNRRLETPFVLKKDIYVPGLDTYMDFENCLSYTISHISKKHFR